MIEGKCRTSHDDYSFTRWPTLFTRVPKIGEYVMGDDGRSLKVIKVIHWQDTYDMSRDPKPYVTVELGE